MKNLRDLESNKQANKSLEPNLVHEEKNLSWLLVLKLKFPIKEMDKEQ